MYSFLELLAVNPVFDAYRSSDLFGKSIFISLIFLSVVTWALFLQKWALQRGALKRSLSLQEIFQKKRFNPLSVEVSGPQNPFSNIYHTLKLHTVELLNKNRSVMEDEEKIYLSRSDIDLIEAHLHQTISSETKSFEKNLFILSTIASLAPFLGLLGTVWGSLLSLSELQGGSAASAHVMEGLAMALGTTVLGLVVAIPALVTYNYLRASIARFATDMDDFSHLLLASVELNYRKVDVK